MNSEQSFPSKPLSLAIILPAYNQDKWIRTTLNSIQTLPELNLSLVIVEDASIDTTEAQIRAWLKNQPPFEVKLIVNERNMGLANSLNIGLSEVTSDFYCVIAGDDVANVPQLYAQTEFLSSCPKEVGLVYSNLSLVDDRGNFLQDWGWGLPFRPDSTIHNAYEELLRFNFLPSTGCVTRTEILRQLGGYDPTLYYEDYGFWIQVAKRYQVLFLPGIAGFRRIVAGSMSNSPRSYKQMKLTEVKILEREIGFSKKGDKIIARRLLGLALEGFRSEISEIFNSAERALRGSAISKNPERTFNTLRRANSRTSKIIFQAWELTFRIGNGLRLLWLEVNSYRDSLRKNSVGVRWSTRKTLMPPT